MLKKREPARMWHRKSSWKYIPSRKSYKKKAKLAPRLECSHNGIILIVNCTKLYGKCRNKNQNLKYY